MSMVCWMPFHCTSILVLIYHDRLLLEQDQVSVLVRNLDCVCTQPSILQLKQQHRNFPVQESFGLCYTKAPSAPLPA